MGMLFKNIEYTGMNGGCFEKLSRTSVPKSIGRPPPDEGALNKIHLI
jgi:hypothetical protein